MKILIAHDDSISCDTALEDVRRAGLPETAQVLILCAVGQRSALKRTDLADSWKAKLDAAEMLAETAGKRIESYFPKWKTSSAALAGAPVEVILNTTDWWRPELVVIGSDDFAPERAMTSNVALEVAHRARCSVRLARRGVISNDRRTTFAIGNAGSIACEAVISEVARRTWPTNAEAHVISVIETTTDDAAKFNRVLKESIDRLRASGLTVSQRLIDGDPHQDLLREAESCNADTIFIGPRRSSSVQRFLLGSVATAVVTRARSTVEVVRRPS